MNYWLHLLIVFEVYLVLALAMNQIAGFTGLLSLGQAALYGIGAYTTALLSAGQGWGFLPAALMSMLVCAILSLPMILCSIRLRGLFFALSTLAIQSIVFAVLYNWVTLTKGPYGITGIPRPSLFGYALNDLPSMALFTSAIAVAVFFAFSWLRRTPLTRLFMGVRDDEMALTSLGHDPSWLKAISILIASAFTGLAGALFASYYSYIDPSSFTLDESILILSIVLIGGAGSIIGAVTGAAFYVLLPELLRFLQLPDESAPHVRVIVYAAVILLVVLYRPQGILGRFRFTPSAS